MANSGANVLEVAAFHGHENINTTKAYYHPDVGHLKAMYDQATKPKKKAHQTQKEPEGQE
jgi:site-specific recombinase XerC